MNTVLTFFFLASAAIAAADEPPVVDTRLAQIVEGAAKESGLTSINISTTTTYSLNINMVNGRHVCDVASATDVKRLQDALNSQPNIKECCSARAKDQI